MLAGDLADTALPGLLAQLAEGAAAGCLHLDGPEGTAEVYLRGGAVTSVVLPGPPPPLGARLVTGGLLGAEVLAAALAEHGTAPDDPGLGDLLVRLDLADADVVDALLREQLLDAAHTLAGRSSGSWHFRPHERHGDGRETPWAVDDLLAELTVHDAVWQRLWDELGDPDPVPVLSASGRGDAETTLSTEAWSLLCSVDGVRTLGELSWDAGLTGSEGAVAMLELLDAGLVSGNADEEPASRLTSSVLTASVVDRLATALAPAPSAWPAAERLGEVSAVLSALLGPSPSGDDAFAAPVAPTRLAPVVDLDAARREQLERAEAERIEAERIEVEWVEVERVSAERSRLAQEQAEAERLAAERVEAERLAAEQAEDERLAAEQADAERVAAEAARLAQADAEAQRLIAEQAEADRVAAETARIAQAQAEAERLAAEQADAERVAAERAEAERAEAAAAQTASEEQQRLEAERIEALWRARQQADADEAARAAATQEQADREQADREQAQQAGQAEQSFLALLEAQQAAPAPSVDVPLPREDTFSAFAELRATAERSTAPAAPGPEQREPEPQRLPFDAPAPPSWSTVAPASPDTDTAALLRELAQLGVDERAPTPPPVARPPAGGPSAAALKKRKGLFGR